MLTATAAATGGETPASRSRAMLREDPEARRPLRARLTKVGRTPSGVRSAQAPPKFADHCRASRASGHCFFAASNSTKCAAPSRALDRYGLAGLLHGVRAPPAGCRARWVSRATPLPADDRGVGGRWWSGAWYQRSCEYSGPVVVNRTKAVRRARRAVPWRRRMRSLTALFSSSAHAVWFTHLKRAQPSTARPTEGGRSVAADQGNSAARRATDKRTARLKRNPCRPPACSVPRAAPPRRGSQTWLPDRASHAPAHERVSSGLERAHFAASSRAPAFPRRSPGRHARPRGAANALPSSHVGEREHERPVFRT